MNGRKDGMASNAGMSRRGFLTGTAVVATGAALGMAGCAAPQGKAEGGTAGASWDKEVDVLVVGSGTGAFAAIAAKDAGAESVMIVEKGDKWGGTSAISGTALWLPAIKEGLEQGSNDTVEDAVAYMTNISEGRGDAATIEKYAQSASEFAQWAAGLMGWTWSVGGMFRDYYEPIEGSRVFGRTASINEGSMWALLQAKCDEMGIETSLGSPVTSLVREADGTVSGVVADISGKETRIKANTCVVLATGGFDHNKEMVLDNQAFPLFVTCAAPTNTGDGHLMAQAIGAATANMDTNWGVPSFYNEIPEYDGTLKYDFANDWGFYRASAGAIVVNKDGRRFGNESRAYAVFNKAFGRYDTDRLEYENIPAFWICDSDYLQAVMLMGQTKPGDPLPEYVVQADTLEELAGKLGIDPQGLADEVAAFNANAANGTDPVFHRGETEGEVIMSTAIAADRGLANPCLAPIATPPFCGAVYVPGTCGTNGGLKINEYAQVLDTKGETIPGLLAVGNCAASFTGGQYAGAGMTLGAGSVMGYVGVRHALGVE